MYDPGLAVLLIWHVGSIIVWLGGSLTFAFALSPSLRSLDDANRKTLFCAFFPKYSKLLGLSSGSAILAGAILYSYLSTVDIAHVPNSLGFIFLTIGAILGLIATIITLGGILPQGSKLLKILTSGSKFVMDTQTKEGTLDEASMMKAMGSSLTAVTVILLAVFVLMILGTNL